MSGRALARYGLHHHMPSLRQPLWLWPPPLRPPPPAWHNSQCALAHTQEAHARKCRCTDTRRAHGHAYTCIHTLPGWGPPHLDFLVGQRLQHALRPDASDLGTAAGRVGQGGQSDPHASASRAVECACMCGKGAGGRGGTATSRAQKLPGGPYPPASHGPWPLGGQSHALPPQRPCAAPQSAHGPARARPSTLPRPLPPARRRVDAALPPTTRCGSGPCATVARQSTPPPRLNPTQPPNCPTANPPASSPAPL